MINLKSKDLYVRLFERVLMVVGVGLFLLFVFTKYINPDEREHLYSSYLVWRGEVPYRDFFQHHHPLLWYVFAPFLKYFHNTPEIWYILRGFGCLVILGILFFIYKISILVSLNKKEAIIACFMYLLFGAVYSTGASFRPDNLMLLFFVAGVYYYFCYVKNGNFKYLILSYILFFLSLMALQKIILLLFVMGGIMLFLPRENQRITLELWCLVVPLCGILLYLFYLQYVGALKDYFELNWVLNLKLHVLGKLYDNKIWLSLITGFFLSIVLFRKGNYYLRTVALLFLAQFCFIVWHAPYEHYLLPAYPFLAVIVVYGVRMFFYQKTKMVLDIVCFAGVVNLWYSFYQYSLVHLSDYVANERVMLSVTKENDEIINGDLWCGGLRKSAYGYYWFGWTFALLDYKLFHRRPFPNLNEIIRIKKPKVICHFDGDMRTCLTDNNEQIEDCEVMQHIEEESLGDDYMVSDFIYLRKY